MIENVQIISEGNEKKWIYPHYESYWKYTDDRVWGSCHTFLIPEFEKKKSLQSVQFYMKSSVRFMVHSPGFFFSKRKRNNFAYNITYHSNEKYQIDYSVYNMLDYNDKKCESKDEYDRDTCNDMAIFEKSMTLINCTSPFLKNKNHICIQGTLAKMARQIDKDSYDSPMCASPCKYLKVSCTPGRKRINDDKAIIKFFFPENIQVHEAYYVYDGLSLIAEIGGYVGLFLGWSVFQITDLIELSIDSCKRRLESAI